MRRMKKRGPNVLYDLNDLLFFLTLITSHYHYSVAAVADPKGEARNHAPKLMTV